MIGEKFGKLTVVSKADKGFNCLCECGNYKDVPAYRLRDGNTRSCGCSRVEARKNFAAMQRRKALRNREFNRVPVLSYTELREGW